MNYNVDDVIKFRDGEYLILDVIKNQESTYLYLINNDEFKNDVSLAKVTQKDGKILYSHIDNNDEFEYVINKIFFDFKNDILEFTTID